MFVDSLPMIILAVLLLGISKAGFGGVGTALALPVMSLGLPPDVALGVLLPLLLATDAVSVWSHRHAMDLKAIWFALPGALVGVGLGYATLEIASADVIGAAIGVLAILFGAMALSDRSPDVSGWPGWAGSVFGSISGFTSTIAHAGGPPIHIYFLAKRYAPAVFVATSAGFMAGVNLLKIIPFFLSGVLSGANLLWSAALIPVAIVSAFSGVYIAKFLSKRTYKITVNSLMILAGLKLVYDAIT